MDREGTEFLLVAASEDIGEELGIELKTENESHMSADVIKDLKVNKKKHPAKPLFKGEWE